MLPLPLPLLLLPTIYDMDMSRVSKAESCVAIMVWLPSIAVSSEVTCAQCFVGLRQVPDRYTYSAGLLGAVFFL